MNRSASMNGILLVAAREIRQILKMKSFWLTLLILPVALAIGPLFAETLEDDEPTRVVVVDRSGGQTAEALEARFAAEDAQWLLRDLSRYVQRYDLEAADPQAPWAQHDRWYTGADIAAFESQGGLEAALAKIDAVRPEGVPEFEPDTPDYSFEPAPAELASAQGDAFGEAARALFDADDDTAPEIVVLIGESYPADPRIQLFSADQPRGSFVSTMQEVLTGDLRARLLASQGVSPADAAAARARRCWCDRSCRSRSPIS